MDALDLRTPDNTDDFNAGHINLNWSDIQERVNYLLTQEANGGNRLSAIAVDDDGLMTMTLSDGTILGPVPLPRAPLGLKGDWAPGFPYRIGDVVAHDGGSLACRSSHESSEDLQDDMDAGRWQVIAVGGGSGSGGGGGDGLAYRHIYLPGEVVTYTRQLGTILVAEACRFVASKPLKMEMLSFSSGNAVTIAVHRFFVDNTYEVLGTLSFTSSERTGSLELETTLAVGEKIRFVQLPVEGTPPFGGDYAAAYALKAVV
ncbi:hypothetical protein [Devosia sp. MC521]|uniref:hypothetical protein n=1 Tax=Devosia sp. MC521 TaxID=2759954 RepID=UPI0015FB291A|nr:hypothetical protein [Devosia sp. MC521]MBJ6986057.1 hypothetical protein [Devosia sp. MC521]QMW61427.1 hypothetical protein H4N61_10575 [Devosia sp. MC521]